VSFIIIFDTLSFPIMHKKDKFSKVFKTFKNFSGEWFPDPGGYATGTEGLSAAVTGRAISLDLGFC